MQVLRDIESCPEVGGTVVTIGAYDGVHMGHREVISRVQQIAAERQLATAVITFDRHPASIVRPGSAPLLLTGIEHKLELLATTEVDYTLVVQFDEARSMESAEDFVRRVMVQCLNAKAVVVGEDFHFGHRRLGNVSLLRELGKEFGFEVLGLPLVGIDGQPARDHEQVSSTVIRRALAQGRLDTANVLLGRPYEIRGIVSHGDKRGREIGFPTANVKVDSEFLMPADAVYSGYYSEPDGAKHQCAISIGTRPTFYEHGALLLEAHLLDFDGDLYDQPARVQLVSYLRDQKKVGSIDELVEMLITDVANARRDLDKYQLLHPLH